MHFELFRIKYIHQHIKSCLKQVKITHSITQVKQFDNFPLLRLKPGALNNSSNCSKIVTGNGSNSSSFSPLE